MIDKFLCFMLGHQADEARKIKLMWAFNGGMVTEHTIIICKHCGARYE